MALAIEAPREPIPSGLQLIRYPLKGASTPGLPSGLADFESKTIRAHACATAAHQLKQQGFTPDLICGHPGWGELLFMRDIWPSTPILAYQEFFYNSRGFDTDFDPELQATHSWQDAARIRLKNANLLLNLESASWNVTPTAFQRKTFPAHWQDRISVIHDGINTAIAHPNPDPMPLGLPDGTRLGRGEPIVSFVNRRLEPYRGCHSFIRAIPTLQQLYPDARLVIVGGTTGVSYGSPCPQGEWKDFFLAEIDGHYDPSRVHFTGPIPHEQFISLLQISSVHVYLSYPFVLSWSLLEAMSCGCAVVGSATAPVEELIRHNHNGLLVDFFKPHDLAAAIAELLNNRALAKYLGEKARATIHPHYSLEHCVPRQLALMDLVAKGAIGN